MRRSRNSRHKHQISRRVNEQYRELKVLDDEFQDVMAED